MKNKELYCENTYHGMHEYSDNLKVCIRCGYYPTIELTEEEAIQLYNCLEREYISHEFHPLVHVIMKRIAEKFPDGISR